MVLSLTGRFTTEANDSAGEVGHQILLPNGPRLWLAENRDALKHSAPVLLSHARAQAAIQKQLADEKGSNSTVNPCQRTHRRCEIGACTRGRHATGDALALELVQETAYYMGWGIANLVNILNPDIVLLGTIAVAAGDLLLDPIRGDGLEVGYDPPCRSG